MAEHGNPTVAYQTDLHSETLQSKKLVETMDHFGDEPDPLFTAPDGAIDKVWWVISLPVAFILMITVPSPSRKCTRRLYPLTFILCVVWIAAAAYIVSWMLSIIGETFKIPDVVMGLTLMAAGGSTPEALSSIIMARKGVGSTGISNGLGANTLNVLMNLGLSWLIKSSMSGPVHLKSSAIGYNCMALMGAVIALNIILFAFRFKLSTKQGLCTLVFYLGFVTFMILSELGLIPIIPRRDCA